MVVAVETMVAPPEQTEAAPEKSAAQQVRDWARDRISGQPRVKAPVLAALALAEIATDELLIELGRGQLYRLVLETIGDTRSERSGNGSAARPQSPEELKTKWEGWLEHAGEHVAVTAMTYQDLVSAIAERRKQVAPTLATIEFLVNLGNKVRGTNLTVGEKLTPAEIEAIRQAAYQKHKVAP